MWPAYSVSCVGYALTGSKFRGCKRLTPCCQVSLVVTSVINYTGWGWGSVVEHFLSMLSSPAPHTQKVQALLFSFHSVLETIP
jgi:hypothetical protein